jgi:hypothetical protein
MKVGKIIALCCVFLLACKSKERFGPVPKMNKQGQLEWEMEGFVRSDIQPDYSYLLEKDSALTYHASTTVKGQITGISKDGEYIEYFPQHQFDSSATSFIRTSYVTNAEWQEFEFYVRDSIARRILQRDDDPTSGVWATKPFDDGTIYPEEEWPLNYEESIFWYKRTKHKDFWAILSQMNYPPHERIIFHHQQLDTRKLNFEYFKMIDTSLIGLYKRQEIPRKEIVYKGELLSHFYVNLFQDSLCWMRQQNLSMPYQELLTKVYAWHPEFKNDPVTGILATQVKAYLHWREKEHNKFLQTNSVDYSATYDLLTKNEAEKAAVPSQKFKIKSNSLSPYRITNEAYSDFFQWVKDSIAFRILQRDDIAHAGWVNETYDDIGDPMPDNYWRINWSRRRDLNSEKAQKILKNGGFYGILDSLFHFSYLGIDYMKAGIKVNWQPDPSMKDIPTEKDRLCWHPDSTAYGYNLDLSHPDKVLPFLNSGVRAHDNRSMFFVENNTLVYPKVEGKYDFTTNPDALVQNITYEQALAYYHWRINWKGHIVEHENPLISHYIPSEEEWKKIQAGEEVILPAQEVKLPMPAFRYVVRFYPR